MTRIYGLEVESKVVVTYYYYTIFYYRISIDEFLCFDNNSYALIIIPIIPNSAKNKFCKMSAAN